MTSVASERLDTMVGTLRHLYPNASLSFTQRLAPEAQGYRFVPSGANPRLAVPAGSATAASLTVQRPCASDTVIHTGRRTALGYLLQQRWGKVLMPSGIGIHDSSDSIEQTLSEIFGQPVLLGLMTGSARANRKPVLSVFSTDGEEIGFAKLGLGELASQLINDEHQALLAVQRQANPSFRAPRPIALADFGGNPLLVMSALRPDVRQRRLWLPASAAEAIVNTASTYITWVEGSPWMTELRETLAAVPAPEAREVEVLLSDLAQKFPTIPVRFGGAHGDFGPWNMARQGQNLFVWDWERFSGDMPAGLDLYHFAVHELLRTNPTADAAIKAFGAPDLRAGILRLQGNLAHHDVHLQMLPLMYLSSLATRFIADGAKYNVTDTFALGAGHLRLARELLTLTQGGTINV